MGFTSSTACPLGVSDFSDLLTYHLAWRILREGAVLISATCFEPSKILVDAAGRETSFWEITIKHHLVDVHGAVHPAWQRILLSRLFNVVYTVALLLQMRHRIRLVASSIHRMIYLPTILLIKSRNASVRLLELDALISASLIRKYICGGTFGN